MDAVIGALRGFERLPRSPWRRRGKQRFVLGESLSLADIWAGHVLYRYFTLDLPRQVPAGLQRILRRPVPNPTTRARDGRLQRVEGAGRVLSRRGDITLVPPAKVTSAEVAERAGVSQSAVSRVFTPGASASAKTVEKVKRAAAELGYRPNILARAMVSGRSRMIGLVVAYLDNQFYPDVLERLSNALQQRGYHVLVFMASQTGGQYRHGGGGDPRLPGGRHHRGLGRAVLRPVAPLPRGGRADGAVQPGAGW
jgi:transcriptional regulator with XRE-family HTH domain